MTLLILFLLLKIPYVLLALAERFVPGVRITPPARARVGVSVFLIFTCGAHFMRAEEMSAMLPDFVPYRMELIYATGILELLGALGVWIPRLMKLAGKCIILMLMAFLPVNVYAALHYVDFGGHGAGPEYLLVRVPFQLYVMWWTYFATEQSWFERRAAVNKRSRSGGR